MLREIDTNVLIEKEITAHHFVILFLLVQKEYDHLDVYLKATKTYDRIIQDLNYLKTKSLVTFNAETFPNLSYKSVEVSPDFIRKVAKFSNFEDIYYRYPIKTKRPDGNWDYLRRDKASSEKIYNIIVKRNMDVHNKIVKCLNYELRERESTNTLGYMKRLTNWLADQEWKNYEDVVDDASLPKEKNTYGTDIE